MISSVMKRLNDSSILFTTPAGLLRPVFDFTMFSGPALGLLGGVVFQFLDPSRLFRVCTFGGSLLAEMT